MPLPPLLRYVFFHGKTVISIAMQLFYKCPNGGPPRPQKNVQKWQKMTKNDKKWPFFDTFSTIWGTFGQLLPLLLLLGPQNIGVLPCPPQNIGLLASRGFWAQNPPKGPKRDQFLPFLVIFWHFLSKNMHFFTPSKNLINFYDPLIR